MGPAYSGRKWQFSVFCFTSLCSPCCSAISWVFTTGVAVQKSVIRYCLTSAFDFFGGRSNNLTLDNYTSQTPPNQVWQEASYADMLARHQTD